MKAKQPLRVFEAFAGIGAQVQALKKAGINYKQVGISEWFIDAIIAYDEINDKPTKIKVPSTEKQLEYLKQFSFSIDSQTEKVNLESLGTKKIKQLYIANVRSKNVGSITAVQPENIPECDLLTYSFPCQDLSTGGKTLGMKKGSGTRSGLLWEIERILKGLKPLNRLPKYLLLENVKTILAPSNKADLDQWLNVLTELGYKNSKPAILDASNFGVPQDRQRCIIVSSLNEEFDILNKVKKEPKCNTLNFIFDDYSNPVYKAEADAASLNPTPSREIMWRINKRENVDKDTTFHTITCNLDRNNNAGMMLYDRFPGRKYRLITMREAFVMMGYTINDYEKIKKLGFSYRRMNKLIGNSIVVNVLVAVFTVMFKENYGK